MVVDVAFAEHPVSAGSWSMGFTKGSSGLVGDEVVGANRSDLQFQLTVIPKLYDGIAPDVPLAVQVSVGALTGR